jgi:S1-C subfamily serine protease
MDRTWKVPTIAWRLAWLVLGYLVAHVVAAHAGEVPSADGQTIQQVVARVAPSVVVIRARGRDAMAKSETRITENGSGVLISGPGRVLTAAYVVHGMDEISVRFPSGEIASAKVVASAPAAADLALLQLDRVPPGAIASPMADSDTVQVGDNVLILGAQPGVPSPLSSIGSIKARWSPNTAYRAMPLAEFFQTDAPIDPGNSGGPMFNMKGEVIGIVSYNIAKGDSTEPQGFVVTLNTARRLLLARP